ncbi:MAG: NAD-binding protein [Oscillospiraceae bacterium]|nr:NAD-binding protein [Oscillospiraceae bacterium]
MGNKRFPLFVSLEGKSAVVVGGGTVGLRRAEVLRRFGAAVTVISPTLAGAAEGFRWVPRTYEPGDLAGAWLAVAATDHPEVNAAVGREARQAGVLFNRSDCPEECGFFFPAICEGDGLVAGIVGDGSDHRKTAQAAREIREVLERMEGDE